MFVNLFSFFTLSALAKKFQIIGRSDLGQLVSGFQVFIGTYLTQITESNLIYLEELVKSVVQHFLAQHGSLMVSW